MSRFSPSDLPVEETLGFVLSALPAGVRRILEVGCGRGALAARLRARGFVVTALDRSAEEVRRAQESGVPAVVGDFPAYEDEPFEAILFTRSLHHLDPLPKVVERARDLLVPGGTLIAEEFAIERVDRETARWFYELRSLLEAVGVLPPEAGGGPLVANPLERWYEEHADEQPLHEGEDMLVTLGRRFELTKVDEAPYLYRYVCERLEAGDRGARVAQCMFELESLRIAERSLRAVGLRIVARKTR